MRVSVFDHCRMDRLARNEVIELLGALGELLGARGHHHELVLIGGAALLLRGVIARSTRDADVLARWTEERVEPLPALPDDLADAVRAVGDAFGVGPAWLNVGPQSLVELGLPDGFVDRLERMEFPPGLVVWLAGRFDLVCFKLYAAADDWPTRGRHLRDLEALEPTSEDLGAAARWVRTHDPSPGFRERQLRPVLAELRVADDDGC
jgi:Nucleotidyltransferase of unknown function (DUF6036)